MPLPSPEEVLGGGNKLPSPSEILGTPSVSIDNTQQEKQKVAFENASQIIDNIPNISGYQKNHIKDLTQKGANPEQLSSAIQGFQKQNEKDIHVWSDKPEMGYGEYAINKLASGSAQLGSMLAKTPAMAYDVASMAMNKSLETFIPKEVIDKYNLGTPYSTDEDNLLFDKLPENKIAKFYDESVKVHQDRTAEKYDKSISEYIANGDYAKAVGSIGGAVLESAPTTISLMMGNAAGIGEVGSTIGGGLVFAASKKDELDKDETANHLSQEEKINIAMSNGLFEGLFEQFGITKLGGLTKNILLRDGKEEAKRLAIDGFKNVYIPALKTFVGTSLAEESIGEAATQFAQNAVDKYSGYKPEKDLMEGVVDAAIVGAASGGVMGAIPAGLEVKANKRANKYAEIIQQENIKAKENIKSEHAFHVSQQGEETVAAFESNVDMAMANGNLTLEEGEKAKHRVRAYQTYQSEIADTKLDDKAKRKIFDLSYQKQGLETEVPADVVEKDLSPIELAKRNAKQTQIKGLQKDIDAIVLAGQVKDEVIVSGDTKKKVEKTEEEMTEREKRLKEKSAKFKAEGIPYLPPEEVNKQIKESAETGVLPKMTDVDPTQFNQEKSAKTGAQGYNHRVKFKQVAEHIDAIPEGKESGKLKVVDAVTKNDKGEWKDNKIIEVEMPSGHRIRMSSSMAREGTDLMGHFREEHLPKSKSKGARYSEIEDFPIGMKIVKTTAGVGGEQTAIKVFNAKTGKIIGWAKATTKGQDTLEQPIILKEDRDAGKKGITQAEREGELKRREDLAREEMVIEPINDENLPPTDTTTPPVKPIIPTNEKTTDVGTNQKTETVKTEVTEKPISKEERQIKENGLKSKMAAYNNLGKVARKSPEGKSVLADIHNSVKEAGYEVRMLSSGSVALINSKGKKVYKEPTKRSTDKIQAEKDQKALDKKILNSEPTSVEHQVVMDIANGVKFNQEELIRITGVKAKEIPLGLTQKDGGISFEFYKTRLAEHGLDYGEDTDTVEIGNEAAEIVETYTGTSAFREAAKIRATEIYERMENQGLTNKEIAEMEEEYADPNEEPITEEFLKEREAQDKARKEAEDEGLFQKAKSDELTSAERELEKAEKAVKAAKTSFDNKRKELDKGIIADQEDLFGERKSTDETSLFDERVSIDARNKAITPFKEQYDNALKELTKWKNKVKEIQDKPDPQQSLFNQKQKAAKGNLDADHHERILKISEHIQKVLPKVKVKYNSKLQAAGKIKGNVLEINPYFATEDTPIHEAAHILLDAIGHNNKVIQAAIKQIKASKNGAKMWETVQREYSELSVEGQENELLAEAIGLEGKGIFDTEIEKSRFKTLLDYIFDWFKRKLGLEKNIAKSLARQIIGGRGLGKLEGIGVETEEKLQKPKKEFARNANDEVQKFAEFRIDQWDRDIEKENEDIAEANEVIKDKNSTEGEVREAKGLKENILNRIREDKKHYLEYKNIVSEIEDLVKDDNLDDFTKEELIDAYWNASYSMDNDPELFKKAKIRIGILLQNEQIKSLQKTNPNFNKDDLSTSDIGGVFNMFKALSDAPAKYPALQSLSKALDAAFLAKRQEAAELKAKHEKLAKAVIAEKNKKLGIVKGFGAGLFSSNSVKYFDYVDNGKGQVLTKEEAEDRNLSKAQTEYLDYFRELNDKRNAAYDENDNLIANDIIKIDPKFREQWKQGGFISALNAYLTGATDLETEIETTDPQTKAKLKKAYGEVQQELVNGKGSLPSKIIKAYSIAFKARKEASIDPKTSSINYRGALTLKSDRPRPKDRGYSKDFYAAANSLIDNYTHVKHMSPLIPLFDSVQQLYKNSIKTPKLLTEYLEDQLQKQIYQQQEVGKYGPQIDAAAKALRNLGSLRTMAWNLPANAVNIFIGNYNNWRKEGGVMVLKGNTRMFVGGRKITASKNTAISKKALDILEQFSVVHPDFDSNPQMKLGGWFNKMAYFFNQVGEYQISGSMFLGHMTKEEWNSFEKVNGKYQLKPNVDKAAFNEKMQSYKDKVSGIQGKYDEKDSRRFMHGEIGKSVAQYKTWMPDWWKSRFGREFINKYGATERGSLNYFTKKAIQELKSDFSGNPFEGGRLKNRQTAANINGLIFVGILYAAINSGGDEDRKKKKKYYDTLSLENALGNLLFVYDPEQRVYLVEHPFALQGLVVDLLKAVGEFQKGNFEEGGKGLLKVAPYGKIPTVYNKYLSDNKE